MPRKRKLSFHKQLKQWYKTRDGKRFYLGKGRCKTDNESYKKALAKWKQIEAKLEGLVPADTTAELEDTGKPRNLAELFDAFFNDCEKRARRGTIGFGYSRLVKSVQKRFEQLFPDFHSRETLNPTAGMFREWHSILMEQIINGTYAKSTVSGTWSVLLSAYRWGNDYELCSAIPNKVRRLRSFGGQGSRDFFTRDQLPLIWNLADNQLKAYLLVALNTGGTAIDISSLRWSDIKENRIIRSRHKTIKMANPVESNHILWGITLMYMKIATRSNDENRVFATRTGNTLVNQDTGKDIIHDIWKRRVQNKVDGGMLSFKYFRKTGAQFLLNFGAPFPAVQRYLSHSLKSTAEQHYIDAQSTMDFWLRRLEVYCVKSFAPALVNITETEAEWLRTTLNQQREEKERKTPKIINN